MCSVGFGLEILPAPSASASANIGFGLGNICMIGFEYKSVAWSLKSPPHALMLSALIP
jgi:hypothetical protein